MVDLALSSVSSTDYLGQTKVEKLDGTMHYHGLCLTMEVLGFSGVAPRCRSWMKPGITMV